MSIVPSLIRTPVGVAVTIVHWVVCAYSVLGDHAEGLGQSTVLQYYLLMLDSPAILLTNLIAQPVRYVLGPGGTAGAFYFVIGITAITLQWLVLGGLLQRFLDEVQGESVPFRIPFHQLEKPNQSI